MYPASSRKQCFGGCPVARSLPSKFKAKTAHAPVPYPSTDDAANDAAEEEHPEAPHPPPPQASEAEAHINRRRRRPPRGGCQTASCQGCLQAGSTSALIETCLSLHKSRIQSVLQAKTAAANPEGKQNLVEQ